MGKLITIAGRTLVQSDKSPPTVTYEIEAEDTQAQKTRGKSQPIIIDQIELSCTCGGKYSPSQTYTGEGNGAIEANTNRVKVEGKSILLEGDKITIECEGTATDENSGATSEETASVTVTIIDTNQTNIFAGQT